MDFNHFRVIDCCCLRSIFQLYHGENKSIFNEMMMCFALLSWIFIVLAH